VGEGDGEAVGEAVGVPVGVPVAAGPVEGTGIVVGAVRSGRGGGSYGPLSAAENAAPTTTATSKHAGASTSTRGTRTNGRTQPSKTYHNNAANTTTTGTDSHHGCPRMNGPSRSPNCPIAAAPRSAAPYVAPPQPQPPPPRPSGPRRVSAPVKGRACPPSPNCRRSAIAQDTTSPLQAGESGLHSLTTSSQHLEHV
jgi:hypothetical protein